MAARIDHRYAVRILREDESVAGEVAIEVDWEPAAEWVRWSVLRRGTPVDRALIAEARVEPVFSANLGAPWVEATRIATDDGSELFPFDYFTGVAETHIKTLVKEGVLTEGEVVKYRILAFADVIRSAVGRRARPVAPRIALRSGLLTDFDSSAVWEGDQRDADDVPVLVPERVLEEASASAVQAAGVETGGILIGHLHRDPLGGDLFTEVTAQIPARHTEATAAKLTFTAETWHDVQAAIALRRRDEIQLGWWHTHPVKHWCTCPEEKRPNGCPMGRGFLSGDDRALHRTVFSRAFNVALVVSDVHDSTPTFALFGWRRGFLVRRGFQRLRVRHHVATG